MDIVFVSLQFPLGTEGLFANVAGILIFRILIHFQTSARGVAISDHDLTMRCRREKECLLSFLGSFTEEDGAKRGPSIDPSSQRVKSARLDCASALNDSN